MKVLNMTSPCTLSELAVSLLLDLETLTFGAKGVQKYIGTSLSLLTSFSVGWQGLVKVSQSARRRGI